METLGLTRKTQDLSALLKEVAMRKARDLVRVTKFLGQLAAKSFGDAGANVAQLSGVTPSLVN